MPHVSVVALGFSKSYICGCSDIPMDMGQTPFCTKARVWDVAIELLYYSGI